MLLLAVIFGLLTTLMLNFYLRQLKDAAVNRETKKIAVAAMAIPAKTIITKEMVVIREVPVESAHASAVTDVNQVVGNLARTDVVAGEQLLKEKLLPQISAAGGLANLIPLGMRAISIPVNNVTGVSGLITPGDRVDLTGTIELDDPDVRASGTMRSNGNNGQINMPANAEKITVTHVLMQNVEVLAVGQNLQPAAAEKAEKNAESGDSTLTLAVTPDKVQVIAMLLEKGKLAVALRSPADRSINNRLPFKSSQLLVK